MNASVVLSIQRMSGSAISRVVYDRRTFVFPTRLFKIQDRSRDNAYGMVSCSDFRSCHCRCWSTVRLICPSRSAVSRGTLLHADFMIVVDVMVLLNLCRLQRDIASCESCVLEASDAEGHLLVVF